MKTPVLFSSLGCMLVSLNALLGQRLILSEQKHRWLLGFPLFLPLIFGNFFRNLNEGFVLLDHAQLETGPFLDGVIALLQIANLGIEARVPDFQLARDFPSVAEPDGRIPIPSAILPCPATAGTGRTIRAED